VFGAIEATGEWTEFFGRALVSCLWTPRFMSEVLKRTAELIRGTTVLMFVMNGFIGMSVANYFFFFFRAIGASDYLGLVSGYASPRQTATTMFGYVFVSKVCCGFTAELGAMKIQQEVDALDATGIDPMHYLVATRIVAVILFTPIACAVALVGQLAGTYFDSVTILHGIAPQILTSVHWSVQNPADQLFALLTMLAIAVPTAITACFCGLRATGGPAEVGSAVARGVLINLILLHVIAVTCAVIFYAGDIHLAIGG
jgi:phospholipid/cholesterol/gamma-HCH transport system permease protein